MIYPIRNVGDYIADLAKQSGVTYKRSPYDDLAEVITRLSGDEVEMDENEFLLFALQRAGVMTTKDVIALQLNYLREKMNVHAI
ncbi:hypothetical protein [Propionivibrio sp.]|uniref:hypothetical protein n=1 Tax=Propionivibrio sp. TaxID=2212460 RepID=UPI003BF2A9DD